MALVKKARPLYGPIILGSLLLACDDDTNFTNVGRNTSTTYSQGSLGAAPEYLRVFQAGTLEKADITIDTGFKLVEQSFLLRQAPKTTELHQQLDRTLHEDNFTQGHTGISSEQSFSIAEAGIFDLLIVIDNSSSMSPYQARLGQTLPSLLTHISNTNWQIAVVTTTSPCLNKTAGGRRVVTRADYDLDPVQAEADFKQLINVGEAGNPNEKGILMATQALTASGCASESNSWLRPDSQRALLLVSDEKNCGSASNEGCPGAAHEKANYFFDNVGTNVTVNGLLLLEEPPAVNQNDPNDPNRACENSGGYLEAPDPKEYVAIVQGTGGIYSDICRSDYDDVLEQISLNVKKKINIQYELEFPAVADYTAIKIDGKPIDKFSVSGKTLTILDTVDPSSAKIEIKYKHNPVPMKKKFQPAQAFDPNTFEVLVNNQRLPAADIQVHPQTGEVELKNMPPEYAAVKIRYRHDTPLMKTFAYTPDFVPGSLEVIVNDKPVKDFTIDPLTRRVTLAQAPLDASSIGLRYELPGDRTTKYPMLGVFADQLEDFTLVDAESGEVLPLEIEDGQLKVEHAQVREGRKVKAIYNLQHEIDEKVFATKIDSVPFPGTVKIEAEGQTDACLQDVSVKADQISFSCNDEDFEKIRVQYEYARDYRNTFDLKLEYSGLYTTTVYVNNQIIQDYHLIGDQLVILKKDLPAGAEIRVLVKPI